MATPAQAAQLSQVLITDPTGQVTTVDSKVSQVAVGPVNIGAPLDPASVVFLLDESGSMAGNALEMVQSTNIFLRKQKADLHSEALQKAKAVLASDASAEEIAAKTAEEEAKDQTMFSMYCFNTDVRTVVPPTRLTDVAELKQDVYNPDGGTALFDAMHWAIDNNAAKKRVMVVVVTDGEENASHNRDKSELTKKIEKATADGWCFVYLAADLTSSKGGDGMGIGAAAAGATTSATNNVAVGYAALSAALERCASHAVSAYRTTSAAPNLNTLARAVTDEVKAKQMYSAPTKPVRSSGQLPLQRSMTGIPAQRAVQRQNAYVDLANPMDRVPSTDSDA
jgi:uncharacterized protein YegL